MSSTAAPFRSAPNIEVGTGVGAEGLSGYETGSSAVLQALADVHHHAPAAVLVFASARHDLEAVVAGVRDAAGEVPIVGATTAGELRGAREHAGSVVVGVLASPYLSVRAGVGRGVSRDWSAALDEALATPGLERFFAGDPGAWDEATAGGRTPFALLLSPGNTRRAVSPSFEILEALKRRSLGRLPIFGGSAADDWRMDRNFVLTSAGPVEDGVLVALCVTELQVGVAFAHGLDGGAGRGAVVTRSRGHEVLELDGRPAADVYAELVGRARAELEGEHLTLATRRVLGRATALGGHLPNVASFFTPDGGVLFSVPVRTGTKLALLDAPAGATGAAGPEALRKAMLRGGIASPAVAIAASCALRTKLLGEAARADAPRMAEALGGAPLLGFRSFGEQAPGDDGVARHKNGVVATLVIGSELSVPAQVAQENAALRREAHAMRERAHAELERLVAERTAQLREANAALEAEIAQRCRAQAAALRHERAARTLGACNEAVVRATDERELLEQVCRIVVDVGGYRLCWVAYAEQDERRTVRPAAKWGEDDGYVAEVDIVWADAERGRGPVGTAIRTGEVVLATSIASQPGFEAWRERAIRRGFASMIALPLDVEGARVGALAIYAADEQALQDEREVKLLNELADDLAFGIAALRGRAERARMTARLMQADRLVAVGTLAAGVAHEINNPLAYLLGGLEFVDEEVRALADLAPDRVAELRSVVEEMRHGGERIRHIVRDLKTFARADEETRRAVDLRRVADSSINLAGSELRDRARLVREYGPVPPVLANESRLGQVVLNLLVNAIHAVASRAADRNEIRVRTLTDEAGRAVLEVSDSGCGIRPENLERVFEPFFTTKPLGQGTGLGLSICRNLVGAIGGEIRVESVVEEGTVVRVVLPAMREGADAPAPSAPGSAGHAPRGRILVVDDEPLVGNALRRALARDHDVQVEGTGRAALARAAAGERFDVILCDLMMPDMPGMALHEALSAVDPGAAGRMVFVTGGAFTPEARAFLERPGTRFVEKPIETDALRALVAGLISAAR